MKKEGPRLQLAIICFSSLILPAFAFAEPDSPLRSEVRDLVLSVMETKAQTSVKAAPIPSEEFSQQVPSEPQDNLSEEGYKRLALGEDTYFTFGLKLGYIRGNTAYDFDHHTSELEYPLNNPMLGADLSFTWKDLSLNTQSWFSVYQNAGLKMKDKDWVAGELVSYTKSRADTDAMIGDVNLRYNFLKTNFPFDMEKFLTISKSDKVRIGVLVGYKYEKFDFDMYDIYYPDYDLTINAGDEVLTYKIKYHIPYIGIATDIEGEEYGLGLKFKYSSWATARDVDNHILRGLTFYGKYDKHSEALMGNIDWFWKFRKDWRWNFGVDATYVKIDGITWEAQGDPDWSKDQNTDLKQLVFWSGVAYRW